LKGGKSKVENGCHWVLDTAFRKVPNQTYQGNAAENLATARRIVMNLLQIDKTYPKSTPKKRMRALIDKKYRELLLSLARSPCNHPKQRLTSVDFEE
jgi:hypothetical protein